MPIFDYLERNARLYPEEVCLVEINPANQPDRNVSWREYNLIEAAEGDKYRREITWREFDRRANRFANLLLTRGVKKGDSHIAPRGNLDHIALPHAKFRHCLWKHRGQQRL